ncbi:aminopeptidase N [Corynebacterium sp. zg912]|uniref:Aminopeptidase N n=1 Tax=Corynebacterium wankanglinii TaxID=2735136 RepID=A0A7H0K9M7_9CORY|nr:MULTISPECIES: aminopeptidase N [Corynebacterium]MBA1837942.1 aminopeptidase N [Corynebacterium wankanglinii]MCR5929284.1 aminopeptidase N [Corynebacterium sp. zg912]QNP93993.1 aminopeptidase N [Corynebacterium wankanglinii]
MKTNLTRSDAQARAALISNVRYDIAVDITGADEFTTVSTVQFDSKAGSTHFDLVAAGFEATLDGEETGRELKLDDGAHTLVVTSHDAYNRTGEGLHKFTDPVDNKDYLYTQFEPAMAMKVFAGFDQPDLKATYTVRVTAPERYTVILNEAAERRDNGDGTATWTTTIDYPLSTYLIAICAGEFERVSDVYRCTDEGGATRVIELGLYARASLIPHLDAERIFRQTKEGFDFYHANFGRTYPFGDKYDQVFCPEYNMGAMEHVGCVTYRDEYIFTSEPTPYRLERRNDTILHEMAHMWFGDLVTMQWWDDLWLNESFATWSAATAQTAIGEYADAWTTFASVEKAWAYQQDQLPSTHPIAADAPDIETAEQNFDGITYAKGASVLKQLQAYVGYEEFFAGVRTHFDNHAYGNATFADLLGALEQASGRDLADWAEQWLRTTGPSTLRPEIGETFAVLQEDPRPHRVRVGLYKLADGPAGSAVQRTHQVETDIDGERTEIPELAGVEHDLAIVNDDDLTYAKMRLTPEHQQFALEHLGEIEDSLARTLIWSSLWESVRDGELAAREFVRLVAREAARETHPSVQERLLAQATQAVRQYVDPAWQGEGMDLLNSAFRGAEPAAIFDRALARLTPTEDTVAYFKDLLERSDNQEVRWLALTTLIAAGALPLSAADEEQDNTSEGAISRLRAKAVVDKRWAWDTLVNEDLTNLEARYLMDGLTFTYDGLEGLTDEYFRAAPALWDRLTNEMAQRTLEGMYPRWDVTAGAVDKANELLLSDAPAGLKRVVAEGQDRIARAVRNREVDATAN